MNKTLAMLCCVVGFVLLGLTFFGGTRGALSMIAGAVLLAVGVIMLARSRR